MTAKELGQQPAYPHRRDVRRPAKGMTIRQRFVLAAMQGLAARSHAHPNSIAELSVSIADALLADALLAELAKETT